MFGLTIKLVIESIVGICQMFIFFNPQQRNKLYSEEEKKELLEIF